MISEGDNTRRIVTWYPCFADEETEAQRLWRACSRITGGVTGGVTRAIRMSPTALPPLGQSEAGSPGKAGVGTGEEGVGLSRQPPHQPP